VQHDLSAERQLIEKDPHPDGWRQYDAGAVRVTCTCGLDTGWTDHNTARETHIRHADQYRTQLPPGIPFSKLNDICELLGLPARQVRALTTDTTHGYIQATLYVLDADGSKVINPAGDDLLLRQVRIPLTG
jgi:hypothetical protein